MGRVCVDAATNVNSIPISELLGLMSYAIALLCRNWLSAAVLGPVHHWNRQLTLVSRRSGRVPSRPRSPEAALPIPDKSCRVIRRFRRLAEPVGVRRARGAFEPGPSEPFRDGGAPCIGCPAVRFLLCAQSALNMPVKGTETAGAVLSSAGRKFTNPPSGAVAEPPRSTYS